MSGVGTVFIARLRWCLMLLGCIGAFAGLAGQASAQFGEEGKDWFTVGKGKVKANSSVVMDWHAFVTREGFGPGGTVMFVDPYYEGRRTAQTFAGSYSTDLLRSRVLSATEARPFSRRTRAAIVYAATRKNVKKVTVRFRDGSKVNRQTKRPPNSWWNDADSSARVRYRFFAIGKTVKPQVAGKQKVTKKIIARRANGNVIATIPGSAVQGGTAPCPPLSVPLC